MAASTPRTIAFAVAAPVARTDLLGLCARVSALLEASGAEVAFCDVGGLAADVVTVEALARLQLAARQHGSRVRLRNASPELRDLVALMGLREVLSE